MSEKKDDGLIFLSAKVPEAFIKKFDEYEEKKNMEIKESGGFKKITKKDLICHAIKKMIDEDTYKI